MTSLRLFGAAAITLAVLTVLILPLPLGTRLFLLAVGVFCAVFIAVDAGGRGKIFAGLVTVALALYLALTAQRGVLLMQESGALGLLLGGALIVLPVLGAWAMIREIIFGSRTQALGRILSEAGELPEDTLPRSASGRIDREAADAQFTAYAQATEAEPDNWKNWFRLSLAYDASGDRKRARKAMRTAINLQRGSRSTPTTI
ncbi:tetratricopeptide repeat protein [Rothia nasimurium]|uniref:tetratricopeptide repeat protein n=1 Tax=Rothia nasimurium TaxID=85336 RepID=UPI001F28D11A|nr:hypothetical protein [Rothia nasimurium]